MKNKIVSKGLSWIVLSSVLMIAACSGAVADISVTPESTLLPTKALATATASATLAAAPLATPIVKTTPTALPTHKLLPSPTPTFALDLLRISELPAGSYLVYSRSSGSSDNSLTYTVLSVDGKDHQELGNGRLGVISPDLKHLAYAITDSANQSAGLYVQDLGNPSASAKLIARGCYAPNWAPDSFHLVMVCHSLSDPAGYSENVFVTTLEGESSLLIGRCVNEGYFCEMPAWSPDGHWVASYQDEPRSGPKSPTIGLYLTDTSCFYPKLIACEPKIYGPFGDFRAYAWSPDSQNLVGYLLDRLQLVIFNVKTRKRKELVTLGKYEYLDALTWSPDGKWIAFNEPDLNGLFVVSSEGGEPISLNHQGHVEFWLNVP